MGAREALNELIGSGGVNAPQASQTTVADVLDTWLRRDIAGRDLAPSTVARHRWAVDHLNRELGTVFVDRLTVRDIEAGLDRLVDHGLSRGSLLHVLSALSQALRYARRREVVDRNVAELAEVPAEAPKAAPRRSLSPDDTRRLLDALHDERNGAMFALSLLLGLRPGEAAGLYWTDLDLDAATVNVTRGVQLRGGRASVVDELKVEAAKRTLRLPGDLVDLLRAHRTTQATERLAAPSWADDRLVFASPTGRVLSPPNVRRQLDALCERADVPRITPNELRHSCASLLSDRGVSHERIADVLGHTTTRMVNTTYRHRLRDVTEVPDVLDHELRLLSE